MKEKLYFIAVIPKVELRKKIREIKNEFKHKFNSSHALKSPAHITLQMPFKRPETQELNLCETLEKAAKKCNTFEACINGFNAFKPRVIFAAVKKHAPFIRLAENIEQAMRYFGLKDHEISKKFHPHMTVATRDLTQKSFYRAWPEFEKRELKENFRVKSIFLLRHNGKSWDIYREFPFS